MAAGVEGRLLVVFADVYILALVRHSVMLGYLSGRHVLPLVRRLDPVGRGRNVRLLPPDRPETSPGRTLDSTAPSRVIATAIVASLVPCRSSRTTSIT